MKEIDYSTVAGIDPSLTGCAVSLFDSCGAQNTHTYSSKPADGLGARFHRFNSLCLDVVEAARGASLCCIEGYSFASKGGKAFDRVEFGGMLRWRLMAQAGVKLIEVPPTTLKLFAAGKGNADKTAMALAVYKRWKVELPDDNQVDAYCLARLAACIAGWAAPENDAQKRAIDSVLKPKAKKRKDITPLPAGGGAE